jgi:hypothetical protein
METAETTAGPPSDIDADARAVIAQALSGQPVDAEAARRVRERAARIREEIYRLHGEIDMATINALFGDDDET